MGRLLQADVEGYVKAMREETDRTLRRIMEAVNQAPDGHVINKSEVPVRDLMMELRERAFEVAVQMRVDQTQGSFSPSVGRGRAGDAEQGTGVA